MRIATTLTLLSALVAGAAMAQDAAPAALDDADAWFESSSVLTQQTGKGIYDAVCASCHMPDGQGAEGAGAYPALANNDMLMGPGYPIYLIVHGTGAMPPLGGVLNDQQIADVVNYISTNFGNDYTDEPATAEMVAENR